MAPSKKSRSLNRRIPSANVVPMGKAEGEETKKWQRKRKFIDTLGPEWSNEELECFYEAYRKHGKDWKKVSAAVHYRSVDMVEALFNINRAYLSLPEGAASAVGLVAMMTDHYAMMERSDSEQDSSDRTDLSRKPLKRLHAKLPQNNSKKIDRNLPDLPKLSLDIPGLSKKRRSGKTRIVGRRTPRIPISYSYGRDFGDKLLSRSKQGSKQKMNIIDDFSVTHEVTPALDEASGRGGPSNFSQTPKRKPMPTEVSPVRNGNKMHPGLESISVKPNDSEFEGGCEISLGSSKCTDVGIPKKRKKQSIKMLGVKERAHYDDINEACSGTEAGEEINIFKRKPGNRVSKIVPSPCKSMIEKGKRVLFEEDRDSAFDALKTLADLSLMMPTSTSDATMQINEEKEKADTTKQFKLKGDLSVPTEVIPLGTYEAKETVDYETNAVDELKEKLHSDFGTRKRKKRSSAFCISKVDASSDSIKVESKKIVVSNKTVQLSPQNTSGAKKGWMRKPPGCTSSGAGLKMEIDGLQSTRSINIIKDKSRYNHGKEKNIGSDKFLGSIKQELPKLPIPWLHDASHNLKERLHHFLSRSQARRWCIFEWFYSAIDYPWFSRREFSEYLDHVGLGHVPCLTRVEWGVIRSSLGKPRRFSKQFLKEERVKLFQHRESVRNHHTSLRSGNPEVHPIDLPQPLSEGQRIVVIHPKSREIHGGYVLTIDHSSCLVQFEQLELGIHWVKDIDCMPLNMLHNIPEALALSIQSSKKLNANNSPCLTGQLKDSNMIQFTALPSTGKKYKADISFGSLPSSIHITEKLNPPEGISSDCNSQSIIGIPSGGNTTLLQTRSSQASDSEQQLQAREADIQALSELTCALDKKDVVLSELRRMNDEVFKVQKDGANALEDSEAFKKQYAAMLLQLNNINNQA
ncbi:hypothetical protein SAY86_014904 [Trapa natans]|uniref:Uncharacterized protein n=1 Tax=Trapa natans TaxID=22666 RepID=A0AAN7KGT2_TRANT|nr:hypothetical protein SAY86_014904 [Trapa natans]